MGQITLFSETDKYGTIKFVNENFCAVSEYSRQELIGKPHNIIRHPDMPRKLFEVMWQTISNGKIFKGIIKNRTKTGSHYWVDTIIMPQQNRLSLNVESYYSIRHLLTNDALAEELYQNQLLGSPFKTTGLL